ncbi:MAG: hypothetical protein ACLPKB_05015 [Xanthobacteraceae bacterium]
MLEKANETGPCENAREFSHSLRPFLPFGQQPLSGHLGHHGSRHGSESLETFGSGPKLRDDRRHDNRPRAEKKASATVFAVTVTQALSRRWVSVSRGVNPDFS